MKREYVSPAFYAENYEVNDSIAACDIKVGESASPDKIEIKKGACLCPVGDEGHHAGKKGNITEYPVNLFNDGANNEKGCDYDWDGKTVTKGNTSYGVFGEAFYGAVANNDNHRPAFDGKVFFS